MSTESPLDHTVFERVTRLEMQSRWMKGAIALILTVIVALVFGAYLAARRIDHRIDYLSQGHMQEISIPAQ